MKALLKNALMKADKKEKKTKGLAPALDKSSDATQRACAAAMKIG
jgi:hypothetical protein